MSDEGFDISAHLGCDNYTDVIFTQGYSGSSWSTTSGIYLGSSTGIGTTAEYFTYIDQVPSWTLEVEPSGGEHPGLPGAGADYGGLGRNSHDGFILPESQQ